INNAFYDSKNLMMVFLPQGVREGQKEIPYAGMPLWKLPFVPVHEYAHHIFATNIPEFKKYGDSHQISASLCFGKISSKNHFEKELTSATGKVKNFEVYSAFNEGFADLVAFYGNGGASSKNSLKSVTCFEKNREVDSSRFYNGQDKKMGED